MQYATCQTAEIHIITSVKDNFASLNVPRWTCDTSAYAIIACDKSFHIPCLQIELNNEPPSCNILRLLYPALHSSGERFHVLSLTPVRITDVFTPLCNCSDAGISPVSHLISGLPHLLIQSCSGICPPGSPVCIWKYHRILARWLSTTFRCVSTLTLEFPFQIW